MAGSTPEKLWAYPIAQQDAKAEKCDRCGTVGRLLVV